MPSEIKISFNKFVYAKEYTTLYIAPESLGIKTKKDMMALKSIIVKNPSTGNILKFIKKPGFNISEDGYNYVKFTVTKPPKTNTQFNALWGSMTELNIKVLQIFKKDELLKSKETGKKFKYPKIWWMG